MVNLMNVSLRWLLNLSIGFAAIALIADSAFAQVEGRVPHHADRVDQFVTAEMPKTGMPGVSVALIENGKTAFSRGYGRASESRSTVTADTPFQVASLSKSFTALCIIQLVDEGRLALDRPVIDYLPEFQTRDKARSDQITIRHLLMHRTGLSTLDGNRYQGTRYRGADALDNAVERLRRVSLRHSPGEAFEYSNANYAILGHLLERLEKTPFEEIVKRRVFHPLGMTNSYVQIPHDGDIEEANGYRHWFGFTAEQPFTAGRMMAPAGGVASSANDMGKYIAAMSNPEADLISAEMRAELFSGQLAWGDTHYALGWGLRRDERGEFIFHEGLNPGFKSVAGFYRETGSGMVVLTNRSSSLGDNFALSILDVAQGREPRTHDPTKGAVATLIGLIIVALALCCGAILAIRRMFWQSNGQVEVRGPVRRVMNSVIIPIGLLALVYGLVVVVPALNGMTLPSIYTFYPDIAVCLCIGGGAALLWSSSILLRALMVRS